MTDNRANIALRLKQLLIASSPLIDEYTAMTCPVCTDVCCKQKHGLYRERDIGYLNMLGIEVPARNKKQPPEGPCESMGPRGCVQPRWIRPFKCTWYFCDPLLAALNNSPQKKVRELTGMMQEMIALYDLLSER